MNVITHALLPVAAKQFVELREPGGNTYRRQVKAWVVLGAFGALPDCLDPHISIGARYNSYSHSWWFTLCVIAACAVFALVRRKRPEAMLAVWCSGAYVLHVVGDIVSGGLDFLGTGEVMGGWWIPPELWPVFDLGFVIAFALFHRRIRVRHGLISSPVRAFLERHASQDGL